MKRLVKMVVQVWALQVLLWATDENDAPVILAIHNLSLAMTGGEKRAKRRR